MRGSDGIKRVIPVYLRPRVAGSFLGFPISEVEHQLRIALDNWTEETDANMRIYYAGIGEPWMDTLGSAFFPGDGIVLVYDTTVSFRQACVTQAFSSAYSHD